jgi:hypothetical protein
MTHYTLIARINAGDGKPPLLSVQNQSPAHVR